ncbi:1-acyl-sn-glycerol-3-phosphate acyltransferase [bacterium]|nr:1-acyl-sn-glycerol-3-phosphate acyltransferase [bacterium]
MKTIRSLYFWTVGTLFFGCLALVLAVLLVFVPPARMYPLVRKAFGLQLKLMGVRAVVRGQEQIEPGRSYLVMGNHESLFDIFIIPVAIPFFLVAVEAAYHFRLPIWGYLVRRWGCLPIDRNDMGQAIRDLARVKEVIKTGASVIILPEGHRTLTGEIQSFKKGPFHLALAAEATILPFAIKGLYAYKSKHSWQLNPQIVTWTFGRPIPYQEYRDLTVTALRDLVRERVVRLKAAPDEQPADPSNQNQ